MKHLFVVSAGSVGPRSLPRVQVKSLRVLARSVHEKMLSEGGGEDPRVMCPVVHSASEAAGIFCGEFGLGAHSGVSDWFETRKFGRSKYDVVRIDRICTEVLRNQSRNTIVILPGVSAGYFVHSFAAQIGLNGRNQLRGVPVIDGGSAFAFDCHVGTREFISAKM